MKLLLIKYNTFVDLFHKLFYNNLNFSNLNIIIKVFKIFKSSFTKLIIPSHFINNYNNDNNTTLNLLILY